jgi:hypothetical protein
MLRQIQDAPDWRVRRTASETSKQPERERRGMRLSHLSWIVIAAIAVAGELLIQLGHRGHMEQFAAPVANVPAFHVLSAADVRPLWRPASQIPPDAIRSASAAIGHVTLTSLGANQPITAAELGPDAAGRHGGLNVVGVPATAAMALDGQLAAGQTVQAIVAYAGRKTGVARVLVLSIKRSGVGSRPYVVLVAVPVHTPRWIVAALGSGTITFLTAPAS